MSLKKVVSLLLLFTICSTVFSNSNSESGSSSDDTNKEVTVTIFSDQNTADNAVPVIEAFYEETGINVEYVVVPGQAAEIYQKVDISLMSGEKTDLVHCNSVYFNKVGQAGLGYDINEFIDVDPNFDAKEAHGEFLQSYNGGEVYGLPISSTRWAVFYNKKLFDEAGVAYPDGTWTWDEYIDTAIKLTDKEKGIYGSYMPSYGNMYHIKSSMAGVSAYKEDGTSNFDDPIFAEGIKWYTDLSAVHNIQQSMTEQKIKKLGSFHFLGGKNAMMLISSWYLNPIQNYEKYPRDWEIGITSIPTFSDVQQNKNFGSTQYIFVNKNSAHPKEAYEYTKFYALNKHKYVSSIPALPNVSKGELELTFKAVEDGTKGEITVDDLFKAYFDNGLGFGNEKLGGVIASEYYSALKAQAELYALEEQDLNETVKNITISANEAIQKAK